MVYEALRDFDIFTFSAALSSIEVAVSAALHVRIITTSIASKENRRLRIIMFICG
jgi:hypothetical protein